MRRQGKTRELTVGVTLTLALALFAGIVTMLGEQTRMFRAQAHYATRVNNSLGLKEGSPVLMGGVQIGVVVAVELPKAGDGGGIDVRMGVDRTVADRIREGSQASVGYITLLSGEKFIEISAGDAAASLLPEGSFIPPSKSETIFEASQNVADNVVAVSQRIKAILDQIQRGDGLLGRLITQEDPYLGQTVLERMDATLQKTNRLLERIESGEGAAGRLLFDQAYADQTLGAIRSSAERLDRILEAVETKQGMAGELIQPDGQGRQILEDLKATSASLKNVSARLESQTGLPGRLLNDTEYSEGVARDLRRISESLASILAKIDRGEGTVGGLVNDPAVYLGMKDIVGGLSQSRFAKGALRHYGKKGAKAAAEEAAGEDPGPPPRAPDAPPESRTTPVGPRDPDRGGPGQEAPADPAEPPGGAASESAPGPAGGTGGRGTQP